MGEGRDTYEKADPHQENEDRFVAEAADLLTKVVEVERGGVIVVAPPAALGVLRKHYDPALKKRLIGEIAKEFTNHPVDEIARLTMAY